VQSLLTDYLTLCEVKVIGKISIYSNVALKKPTKQSSTAYSGSSSRAVDGNTDADYKKKSCTHTSTSLYPWWRVDLLQKYKIKDVIIQNRGDCCGERLSKFKIYIGDKDGSNSWKLSPGSAWNHGVHIKNRHGKCISSQPKVYSCNEDPKKTDQSWSYDASNGRLRPRYGTRCMAANFRRRSSGNWVNPVLEKCNSKSKGQQWVYNAQSGQLKNANGACLDAYQRNTDGGKVIMRPCNNGFHGQRFDLARYNYGWRDGNLQCGGSQSIDQGKQKSISCRHRSARYVWIVSSKTVALTLCEVQVLGTTAEVVRGTPAPTPAPTPLAYGDLTKAKATPTAKGFEVPKGVFEGCASSFQIPASRRISGGWPAIPAMGKSAAYMKCMKYGQGLMGSTSPDQCDKLERAERAKYRTGGA
jgi:hypothetical protein